jgi:hypothetical protein
MADTLAGDERDGRDRMLEDFLRPGGGGRLATRVGECNQIDVANVGHFSTLSPHRKTLLLCLLLCLKDRATGLRFEPQDADLSVPGVRVSYVVGGEAYELVPPPLEMAIQVIRKIKELAGLRASRGRMPGIWRAVADRIGSRSAGPAYGGFRIGAGGRVCEVTVMAQPAPRADPILMQISAVDPAVARIAEAALRQLFEDHRNAARESEAEGPTPA